VEWQNESKHPKEMSSTQSKLHLNPLIVRIKKEVSLRFLICVPIYAMAQNRDASLFLLCNWPIQHVLALAATALAFAPKPKRKPAFIIHLNKKEVFK